MKSNFEILTFQLNDSGEIPNNPCLPLIVYRKAVEPGSRNLAAIFEGLFPKGGWYPAWRWGVYPFPHYHSTAHEVLGVYQGTASIRMGHTTGITLEVKSGDVLIIPAGVGHQNLGSSANFHVVGGYPDGQEADLLRRHPGERPSADRNIASVPLPIGDPIFGMEGPLRNYWG